MLCFIALRIASMDSFLSYKPRISHLLAVILYLSGYLASTRFHFHCNAISKISLKNTHLGELLVSWGIAKIVRYRNQHNFYFIAFLFLLSSKKPRVAHISISQWLPHSKFLLISRPAGKMDPRAVFLNYLRNSFDSPVMLYPSYGCAGDWKIVLSIQGKKQHPDTSSWPCSW